MNLAYLVLAELLIARRCWTAIALLFALAFAIT